MSSCMELQLLVAILSLTFFGCFFLGVCFGFVCFLVPFFWFVLSLIGLPTGLCNGPLPALLRLLNPLTALQAITIQLVCCGWTFVTTWRKPWRRWTGKKSPNTSGIPLLCCIVTKRSCICCCTVCGCPSLMLPNIVKVWWEDVQCTEPPWTYLNIFKPILEQCMCMWTVR